MHGIPPCSILAQKLNKFELRNQIGPSAMRLNATVFFARFLRFRMLGFLRCFRLFQLFNTPFNNTHFSTFLSPNLLRPTLVASYAPSDPPEPLFTSVLCGCYRLLSLSPNPDSREEILAFRSSATPQHRNTAITVDHHQRHRRHNDWYAGQECDIGMRNDMR